MFYTEPQRKVCLAILDFVFVRLEHRSSPYPPELQHDLKPSGALVRRQRHRFDVFYRLASNVASTHFVAILNSSREVVVATNYGGVEDIEKINTSL